MGKNKKSKNVDPLIRKPIALTDQLGTNNNFIKLSSKEKKRKRKLEDDEFVGPRETKKILKNAQKQLNEVESAEEDIEDELSSSNNNSKLKLKGINFKDDDDDDDESDEEGDSVSNRDDDDGSDDDDDDKNDDAFDENIEKQLKKSIKNTDVDNDSEIKSQTSEITASSKSELSEDLVKLFKKVGQVLSNHRHGPVPKALKIIPKYRIWEELLELTNPDKWSAAAVLAATRIFVSNLKDKQVARYVNRVLLPRVRDDIAEFKRLNDHLYQALVKCMFKSYGFIKGFLLPLCKEGDCSAREATIISSVLARSSIKMEHSAAAMMELCQMPYSPANCIFLTTLMDKKYALPYVVVDELVNYFLRFQHSKEDLTVLWHQCLLTFAQRYKQDVSSEQKEALLQLLKSQPHKDITPEIRNEFVNARCRDIEMVEPPVLNDME